MSLEVSFQAKTDIGKVRTNNEDAFVTSPEIRLFAVCDGLGGHAAGEVASRIASEVLRDRLSQCHEDSGKPLEEAIFEANRRILSDQKENPERSGMGTTVSALWFCGEQDIRAWIGHIGDSRIYKAQKGLLDQLTEDHSPIFRLYKEGKLDKSELRFHPQKNLIERSLGLTERVRPDIFSMNVEPDDVFLLCTDGLTDVLSDEEISQIMESTAWENLADTLVKRAVDNGGYDNVTVVLARILKI